MMEALDQPATGLNTGFLPSQFEVKRRMWIFGLLSPYSLEALAIQQTMSELYGTHYISIFSTECIRAAHDVVGKLKALETTPLVVALNKAVCELYMVRGGLMLVNRHRYLTLGKIYDH